jgi:hypothetical protein
MWGFFMLIGYLYRKQFIMYKNFNLTESEKEQILNQHKEHGYKKSLNEQEIGGQNWGKGGTLIRLPKGSNNTNDAIRIQSDLRGDKYDVVISVQSNKKVRSEIKGNTIFKTVESMLGNKFQEKGDWTVVSGDVDSNTYNKIVKLLSSLGVDEKNNTFVTQVSEQSFEDYSSDMESETQSNDINLQEQLLFIVEHLDGGHTEDSNVTPEKMVEVLKETIKQFVNPNDSITVRDWEKLYYSITNDMYA